MGFGKRSKRNRNNGYRKKKNLKKQVQIVGIIFVIIGFLISFYDLKYKIPQSLPFVIGFIVIGMTMILQRKLLDGLKESFKEQCNCCKCTNCNSNHNHWTH